MTSQARGKSEPVEALTSSSASISKPNTDAPTDEYLRTRDDERRKRQQSSSENIDKLLASGRSAHREQQVAVMGSSSEEPLRPAPGSHLNPRQRRDRDTESSADEETNMIGRSSNNGVNYQGTGTTTTTTITSNPQKKAAAATRRQQQRARAEDVVEGNEEDEAAKHQGWWARVLSKYGSIELENKGSVARDHLALERTFLAWLRTSLAFASIGIAITQLFRLNVSSAPPTAHPDRYGRLRSMGKPLGATFLGISIVMLFIGFHRYFESQHWIIRGKFPASRGSIIIVALVTFALMVTSLVVVIVVEPGATEK